MGVRAKYGMSDKDNPRAIERRELRNSQKSPREGLNPKIILTSTPFRGAEWLRSRDPTSLEKPLTDSPSAVR